MTQEALKLALEALYPIAHNTTDDPRGQANKAITAIKEALAQEQEPVAWMFQHDKTGRMNYVSNDGVHNPTMFLEMNPRYALVCPLYPHPQRTWVGLTEDEIAQAIKSINMLHGDYATEIAYAIESKLKELNT